MIVSSTPDVRVVELDPSDTAVVVASDGLWDVMQDQEAAHIVSQVITDLQHPLVFHAHVTFQVLLTVALSLSFSASRSCCRVVSVAHFILVNVTLVQTCSDVEPEPRTRSARPESRFHENQDFL